MTETTTHASAVLLKSRQVSLLLGVSESTLSRWRTFGGGPAWVNLGGNPRYVMADIEAFIRDNRKERQ